jgi:hypothetical protein
MSLLLVAAIALQAASEVRQFVTFRFLGGKSAAAIQIFREQALPLYVANEPMLRFRAFREVESPEPLDLVVVSSFRGLEGMDSSNKRLAEDASKRGTRVGDIYGKISASSDGHRDELVEMDPGFSWGDVDGATLVVLVRLRLSPGRRSAYEKLLRERLVPWEMESRLTTGADSGRFLLSNGYDYLRVLGIENLAAWQRYVEAIRGAPFASELDGWIEESSQVILAPVRELDVR